MAGSVLIAGETVVDLVPAAGSPGSWLRRAGGGPTNVAAGLATWGQPPALWSCLGGDPMAAFLADRLDELGLDGPFVERDPDAKTTLAVVAHDQSGERSFTFYRDRPADARLTPGTVTDDQLARFDWLLVGGIALAGEPSRTAVFDLLARARETDCTVVVDPNARPAVWTDGAYATTVQRLLERADVLCGAVDDLRQAGYDGRTATALAESLLETGLHTVILTQGDSGAVLRATADSPVGQTTIDHPGYSVSAVDTTGAGDGFLASIVHMARSGVRDGWRWLDRATAVGALTTTERGGLSALPTQETVQSFLAADSVDRSG